MNKKDIRKKILAVRNAIIYSEYLTNSEKIANYFENYTSNLDIDSVFAYFPSNNEVNTKPVINSLLKSGVKVALPRVIDSNKSLMKFYYITSIEDVVPGYMGIYEPDINICKEAISKPDIVIVPGVAFDKNLNRIGYGKGYYDIYFSNSDKNSLKIAFSFDCQLLDNIDTDDNDVKMDVIITESRVLINDK